MRGVLSRGGESNATMFGGLTSGGVPPEFYFHSEIKGFLPPPLRFSGHYPAKCGTLQFMSC